MYYQSVTLFYQTAAGAPPTVIFASLLGEQTQV